MFKVIFYKDRGGSEPIKDFLIDLSQKTPPKEIALARSNLKDFLERMDEL